MANNNVVEIRVTAVGADQAAKVLKAVADAGGDVGRVTAAGAEQATKGIRQFQVAANQVSSALSEAGVNTGVFGRAISVMTNPIILAGVAVGALAAGVMSATNAMVANAKEVKALMAVSGLQAEAADNLADTFQLLGVESASLTNAIFKMGTELENGGTGLRKLGLTIDEVSKATNEGELFLMVRDKISSMSSASERSAALMAVFGRAGRELAAAFSLSREEFIRWTEKAGGISAWGEGAQKSTEAYSRSLAELGLRFDALKQSVGAQVIPTLTHYLGILNQLVGAKDFQTTITVVLKALGAPDETKPFHQQLIDIFKGVAVPMGAAMEGGFRGAGASGTWDLVVGPKDDTRFKEQRAQADMLSVSGAAAAVMSAIAQEEIARKSAVQLGLKTEEMAASERIFIADRELDAKKKVLEAELRAVDAKDDLLGTKRKAVLLKIEQAEQEAAAKRAQLEADFVIKRIAEQDRLLKEEFALAAQEQAKFKSAFEHDLPDQAGLLKILTDHLDDIELGFKVAADAERGMAESFRQDLPKLDAAQRDLAEGLRIIGRNEEFVEIQAKQAALARINSAITTHNQLTELDRNLRLAQLQGIASARQASGDFFGFLGAQFALTVAMSNDVWQSIGNAAQSTFQNMQAFASDFLFDFITGTLDAGEAFEQFGKRMLRVATDLLAEQGVRALFSFIFGGATKFSEGGIVGGGSGGGSGSSGGIFSGLGSLFGGGSGGSVTDIIPALLSKGEAVLTSDTVKKIFSGDFSGIFDDLGIGDIGGSIMSSLTSAGPGLFSFAGAGAAAGLVAALLSDPQTSTQHNTQAAQVGASAITLGALAAGASTLAATGAGAVVAIPAVLGMLFGKGGIFGGRGEQFDVLEHQAINQLSGSISTGTTPHPDRVFSARSVNEMAAALNVSPAALIAAFDAQPGVNPGRSPGHQSAFAHWLSGGAGIQPVEDPLAALFNPTNNPVYAPLAAADLMTRVMAMVDTFKVNEVARLQHEAMAQHSNMPPFEPSYVSPIYAFRTGLTRVPGSSDEAYGPVFLHGQERVLTARQADAMDRGGAAPSPRPAVGQPLVVRLELDGRVITERVLKDIQVYAKSGRRTVSSDAIEVVHRG